MDNQILKELYSAAIEAAQFCGEHAGFIKLMEEKEKKIREPRLNSYGGSMEWREDYEEAEPGHRHMSHLFSLHPGTKINPVDTPEPAAACERTLEHRLKHGGGHTGWSCAWIVNKTFYFRVMHIVK